MWENEKLLAHWALLHQKETATHFKSTSNTHCTPPIAAFHQLMGNNNKIWREKKKTIYRKPNVNGVFIWMCCELNIFTSEWQHNHCLLCVCVYMCRQKTITNEENSSNGRNSHWKHSQGYEIHVDGWKLLHLR